MQYSVYVDYAIIGISMVISLIAQLYINHNYKKYSKEQTSTGINGLNAARTILNQNGLQSVQIESVTGTLTDHYTPSKKTVSLSERVYSDATIASVGVAAHECGHAIQDKDGYIFLRVRKALAPIVSIASYLGYFAILIGVIASIFNFIRVGILMEFVILLFQLITLPVEFNASSRALKQIQELNLLADYEYNGAKKMLISAALTYVASVVTTLLQILRLLLIFGRRRD